MKITLILAGKPKEPYLSLIKEYCKRSGRFANFNFTVLKDNDKFEDSLLSKIKKGKKLLLFDEKGKAKNSIELAEMLRKEELGSEELIFAIGPANGFSNAIKEKSALLLSLSKLTMPHELAALFASEALYRALSIKAEHPYHRN